MKVKRMLGVKLYKFRGTLGEYYEPLLKYEVVDLPDDIFEKISGVEVVEEGRGRKKKKEEFVDEERPEDVGRAEEEDRGSESESTGGKKES